MPQFQKLKVPSGEKIKIQKDGKLTVPNNPIIVFLEGDGTGPDIWHASQRVFDAAVEIAYKGKRKISWLEAYAGEKAAKLYDGAFFPHETLEAIQEFIIAIKGPLTTPVG